MWFYLLQGMSMGLAAGAQPGPLQTYLISQSLLRGWKRTLISGFAPLLSDGPIILLSLLILSQVPDWLQRGLYIAGGLFVLYLAYGAFKSWQSAELNTAQPEVNPQRSLFKAAFVNVLNPIPYVSWMLVLGPTLMRGWREAPLNGVGFLAGFYSALVGSLLAIIIISSTAQKLGSKFNRVLLGLSAIALFCFGLYELYLGIAG
ncbi:MAG: LysE family transporter [Chloroflexota bacterium]